MSALAYLELALSAIGAYTVVSCLVLGCWVALNAFGGGHQRGVERLRADRERQARLRLITSPEPERRGGAA